MAISASARVALLTATASLLFASGVRDHYDMDGSEGSDGSQHGSLQLHRERADNTGQVASLIQDATLSGLVKVQVMIFDFDNTLSVIHITNSISGITTDSSTEPPKWPSYKMGGVHAVTQLGQVRRVRELDKLFGDGSPGSFALEAFGGKDRVDKLKRFLEELEKAGVKCYIATHGFVGAVIRILRDLDLLKYFKEVRGRIDHERASKTLYDQNLGDARDDELTEINDPKGRGTTDADKMAIVQKVIQQEGIEDQDKDAIAYVDDDYFLWTAKICHPMSGMVGLAVGLKMYRFPWLTPHSAMYRRGIQDEDMEELLSWVHDGYSRSKSKKLDDEEIPAVEKEWPSTTTVTTVAGQKPQGRKRTPPGKLSW
jgi:hypothetical protein